MAFHSDHDKVSADVSEDSFRLYNTIIKFHQGVNPDTLNVNWHGEDNLSIIVNKAKGSEKG